MSPFLHLLITFITQLLNDMTSSELFEKAQATIHFDNHNVKPEQQNPFGFFPGGRGTFAKGNIIKGKKVMVLGNDYDTLENFNKGEEDHNINPTWRGIKQLLEELGIALEDCFFTNAYLGLRKEGKQEGKRNTGAVSRNANYRNSCIDFLRTQIETVQPQIILALGKEPLKALACAYQEHSSLKRKANLSATAILNDTGRLREIIEVNGNALHIYFVLHPSLNAPNRTKIFGKGKEEYEVVNLKKAMATM